MRIRNMAILSVVGVTLLLTATGCDINSNATRALQHEADSLINAAYEEKDYQRIVTPADSLKKTEAISEGKAYYWLGYASDRTHQKRMAELYWTQGMAVVDNAKTPEELEVYAAIASRLTGLISTCSSTRAAARAASA